MIKKRKTKLGADIGVIRTFQSIENKPHFAIGEFVDNSVQSYLENEKELKERINGYKPKIEIFVENDLIAVEDNCAGIAEAEEERAFMVASPNPNVAGIGTFGMGMKVSACWFSNNWKVISKPLNEKYIKTWEVDVAKILKTKDPYIGPEYSSSDGNPFTRIEMHNPQKSIRASAVTLTKEYLADMYRWFITDMKINIEYNGELLEYKPKKIKKMAPRKEPKGEKLEWVTEIPKIDLGEGFWANGVAYLRDKGETRRQRGFAIFWKERMVTGSWADPWMPSNTDYETKVERDKYAIYGASNAAVAQRLEGYLRISPNFDVPSTKNGVLWDGRDEKLKEELKKYLQNCELVHEPSKKKFDFLDQARNGRWTSDKSVLKSSKELDEEAKKNIDDKKVTTFKKDDVEEDSSYERPVQTIIETEDAFQKTFQYEDTSWTVTVYIDRNDSDRFVDKTDGPDGKKGDKTRTMQIRINLGHSFVDRYFSQGDGAIEREGVIKFALALIMAETLAKESSNKAISVRRILNSILDKEDF